MRRPASAGGKSDSPLASFYFGSFRNNYVDNRPEKRYREMESFPGFEIDEISRPPLRQADRRGQPAADALRRGRHGRILPDYVRPAVFAGAMLTQDPEGDSHHYMNVGAQLDFNFNVAMRLPMVFSIGAGGGFEDGDYRKTELLASLKIM